jgi:hypothetical protein
MGNALFAALAAHFVPAPIVTIIQRRKAWWTHSSSSNWLSCAHAAMASFSMKKGVCRGVYLEADLLREEHACAGVQE